MLFSRKTKEVNKEALSVVLKENKRLKRENQNLRNELEEVSKLKNGYKELIDQVHKMKLEYVNKLNEFDELKAKYAKELDEITKRK